MREKEREYQKNRRMYRDYWLREAIIQLDGSLDKFEESGYTSKRSYLNNRKKFLEIMKKETENDEG